MRVGIIDDLGVIAGCFEGVYGVYGEAIMAKYLMLTLLESGHTLYIISPRVDLGEDFPSQMTEDGAPMDNTEMRGVNITGKFWKGASPAEKQHHVRPRADKIAPLWKKYSGKVRYYDDNSELDWIFSWRQMIDKSPFDFPYNQWRRIISKVKEGYVHYTYVTQPVERVHDYWKDLGLRFVVLFYSDVGDFEEQFRLGIGVGDPNNHKKVNNFQKDENGNVLATTEIYPFNHPISFVHKSKWNPTHNNIIVDNFFRQPHGQLKESVNAENGYFIDRAKQVLLSISEKYKDIHFDIPRAALHNVAKVDIINKSHPYKITDDMLDQFKWFYEKLKNVRLLTKYNYDTWIDYQRKSNIVFDFRTESPTILQTGFCHAIVAGVPTACRYYKRFGEPTNLMLRSCDSDGNFVEDGNRIVDSYENPMHYTIDVEKAIEESFFIIDSVREGKYEDIKDRYTMSFPEGIFSLESSVSQLNSFMLV